MFAPRQFHPSEPGQADPERADEVRSNAIRPRNRAWQALMTHAIETHVTKTGDAYEQEAERTADHVMSPRNPSSANHPVTIGNFASNEAQPSHSDPENEALEGNHDKPDGSSFRWAPAIVGQGLSSPGQPLDPAIRAYFEPRFGRDFSQVRVHDDAQAAASAGAVRANAFTLGSDIVFGSGAYRPQSSEGRRLLAHELTHVVQQQARPGSPAMIARQTFGTEKTTAPPAKNESPGDVFRGQLKDEVALFGNAGVILDWLVSQRSSGGASVTGFKASSLFADTATMRKLKPQPAAEADLAPALAMLEYHNVVKSKGPGDWEIVLAPLQQGQSQPDVNRDDFDQKRTDITAFQRSFETRFDTRGHPIKQIAHQELLEDTLAAGARSEFEAQKTAETKLAAVTAELDEFVAFRKKGPPVFRVTTDNPAKSVVKGTTFVMLPIAGQKKPTAVDEADFDRIEPVRTGASPEVEARRKAIEKRVAGAEKGLYDAQTFHRFSTEMVWFLHELEKTSSIKFKAGTYPHHGKFGEYAADMYPTIAESTDGFYKIDKAEQFVDDINKVAEAGHKGWGKFAWQIVYNDTALQATINAKYGSPRMSSAPHHGPSPDKLHMHLDIRPLNVVADPDTGFGVNKSGRVELY
ncbi:MAG TPA: DUF4157 domain-containing protein [Blastocatellia bacterium]|nr:DUF4157 domain-containing protein [Blastocatellia bacterium]